MAIDEPDQPATASSDSPGEAKSDELAPVRIPRVWQMYEHYRRSRSLRRTGEAFGVSGEWVRQLFDEAQIETLSRQEVGEHRKELTRQLTEEIEESFEKLKDPDKVAAELGVPKEVVKRILRAAGLIKPAQRGMKPRR